jgi:hypothetical protein
MLRNGYLTNTVVALDGGLLSTPEPIVTRHSKFPPQTDKVGGPATLSLRGGHGKLSSSQLRGRFALTSR